MRQVFNVPRLSLEDRRLLHASMERLVLRIPRLAEQVVAACADPDSRVAFAALVCTKLLLCDKGEKASGAMLKAGAIPAVMSALKHSNAYCRAAAASVAMGGTFDDGGDKGVNIMGSSPETTRALLEAGLVPALMDIVRAGASENAPSSSPGVFSNVRVQMASGVQLITLPNFEPALHACNALGLLVVPDEALRVPFDGYGYSKAKVAAEVASTPRAAAVLVQCLRQYTGELRDVPGQLIRAVVLALAKEGGSSQATCLRAFCTGLLQAGLPDLLPSLIKPEQPNLALYMMGTMMETFEALGPDCLPPKCLPAFATACAESIAEVQDPKCQPLREDGACCLGLALAALGIESLKVPLSRRCIKSLASVMVSGPFPAAGHASVILVNRIDIGRTGGVLEDAMAGGFVPGIFRVARERHRVPGPLVGGHDRMVVCAVQWIVHSEDELYINQAVDSGLLPFLESYLSKPEFEAGVLMACTCILEVPSALAKLRTAGLAPSFVRAAHSPVELGRWVSQYCRAPGLVTEFVDAGLLEKLDGAKSNMAGQPAKQREVAALIDELARIAGSGSRADGSRRKADDRELGAAQAQVGLSYRCFAPLLILCVYIAPTPPSGPLYMLDNPLP